MLKFEKPIRIKIQVLPTDTVAQWVEHRRDKPRTRFKCWRVSLLLFFPLRSFSATMAKHWKVQF